MPKRKTDSTMTFGERLAELRKKAGFTQAELAQEIGISQRMVAYYERQTDHPPTTLLPEIAKALGVSTDALLGVTSITKKAAPRSTRLQRRLQQLENLDPREKRQVLQIIDSFIERDRLKRRAG